MQGSKSVGLWHHPRGGVTTPSPGIHPALAKVASPDGGKGAGCQGPLSTDRESARESGSGGTEGGERDPISAPQRRLYRSKIGYLDKERRAIAWRAEA